MTRPLHPLVSRGALGLAVAATMALAGCGHSDNAAEAASSENVEMPAEEAMSGVASAPVADPSAAASVENDPAQAAADQAVSAAADVKAAADEAAAAAADAKAAAQKNN
ncbi:MAG TPA: hypothetical protein VN222_14675 [Novosphingobium sp.]|nr:hypothetical protein [Novosphingobium sp.]